MDDFDSISLRQFVLNGKWGDLLAENFRRYNAVMEIQDIVQIISTSKTPLRRALFGVGDGADFARKCSSLQCLSLRNCADFTTLANYLSPRSLETLRVEIADLDPGEIFYVLPKITNPLRDLGLLSNLTSLTLYFGLREGCNRVIPSNFMNALLQGFLSGTSIRLQYFSLECAYVTSDLSLDLLMQFLRKCAASLHYFNANFRDYREDEAGIQFFARLVGPQLRAQAAAPKAEVVKSRLGVPIDVLHFAHRSLWYYDMIAERCGLDQQTELFACCHPCLPTISAVQFCAAFEVLSACLTYTEKRSAQLDWLVQRAIEFFRAAEHSKLLLPRSMSSGILFSCILHILNVPTAYLSAGLYDALVDSCREFICRQPYMIKAVVDPDRIADQPEAFMTLFANWAPFKSRGFTNFHHFMNLAFDFNSIAFNYIAQPRMLLAILSAMCDDREYFATNADCLSLVGHLLTKGSVDGAPGMLLEATLDAFCRHPERIEQLMEVMVVQPIAWSKAFSSSSIRAKLAGALRMVSWQFFLVDPILPAIKAAKQLFGLKSLLKDHHSELCKAGFGNKEPDLTKKFQFLDAAAKGVVRAVQDPTSGMQVYFQIQTGSASYSDSCCSGTISYRIRRA